MIDYKDIPTNGLKNDKPVDEAVVLCQCLICFEFVIRSFVRSSPAALVAVFPCVDKHYKTFIQNDKIMLLFGYWSEVDWLR